jgi:hypothetical protein
MGDILELNTRLTAIESLLSNWIEKIPALKQAAEEGGLIQKAQEPPKPKPKAPIRL